jgi:hypothetical protein
MRRLAHFRLLGHPCTVCMGKYCCFGERLSAVSHAVTEVTSGLWRLVLLHAWLPRRPAEFPIYHSPQVPS